MCDSFQKDRDILSQSKRIVIKIGTSSLTYDNGRTNLRRIGTLVRVISDLMNQGKEVILVSSGAIGIGVNTLKMSEKPSTVAGRQAVAAVGQCNLMQIYSQIFSDYGYNVGQLLLTRDILDREEMKKNTVNTFNELLKLKIIPIVNENDSVAVEEIKFGDNDNLSYVVSTLTEADLLVILTDIDGYYDKNPSSPDAKLYHNVYDLSEEIEKAAGGAGSKMGTGGMLTKVHASRLAAEKGINSVIVNGSDPRVIFDILDGHDVGTLFVAKNKSGKKEG